MGVSIKDIDGLNGLITDQWSDWTDTVEVTQDLSLIHISEPTRPY